MIKSLAVSNYRNETINLVLASPEKSGFAVLGIDGLGPVKATINASELGQGDGTIFNSARISSRNIVIRLKFLHSPTIENIRQKSYKYFPIKRQVKLLIETDNRKCWILGFVESNEPTIFSNFEGCQLSILCTDPYFYSEESVVTVFSGITDAFEFPFENTSLTEPTIEFGIIERVLDRVITYYGDAEVGVNIRIDAVGQIINPIIYNTGTREYMKINTEKLATQIGSPIVAGDTILISTIQGSKSMILIRDGVKINILNALDRNSAWFKLAPGENVFTYSADDGLQNIRLLITNNVLYEGV